MGKAQRDKGKLGEREVAHLLVQHGFEEGRRTAQYCGNTGDASDVVGLPGYHIEVKRCETTKIHEWMAQATRDAKPNEVPIVCHRRSRENWLVTLPLEAFLDECSKAKKE